MKDSAVVTTELARGKFTDEMLEEMRALIGTELRTDACVNNEYATRLAILRFAEGIGDDNPLWTDPEYAARSPHGTLIAPPSFIFACLGSVQVGWRGLGGFHADTTVTFHRTIRVGDRITARVVFDGFEGPVASSFAGRRIKDYLRQEYRNQDGELVATFICSRVRFERTEAQRRAPSRTVQVPHPWTEQGDRRDRGAGAGRGASGCDAALLGRRRGGRRDRHHHEGTARSHRQDRVHRRRCGTDPPALRTQRRTPALPASPALGLSRPGDPRPRARVLRASAASKRLNKPRTLAFT
jgi:acyl dehydratase